MYRALFVVLLFAFAASALSKREVDIAAEIRKCRAVHGVSENVQISLTNPGPLMAIPETRCFAKCIMTVTQTFKPDGSLNVERLTELLPKDAPDRDQTIRDYNFCAKENGTDTCDTAYKIFKCLPGTKSFPIFDIREESFPMGYERCKVDTGASADQHPYLSPDRLRHLFDNPKTRCYAGCILAVTRTLKADGSLWVEKLERRLPQDLFGRDEVVQRYNSCAEKKGADACETAYKAFKCWLNKAD